VIRKLRLKFICINMLIVLILLSVMLGLLFVSTRQRIERESIQMMRTMAAGPMLPFRPDDRSGEMKLPFFRLTLDKNGNLVSTEGSSYDLSDEAFLQELLDSVRSSDEESGVLKTYNLRYLRRSTPREEIIVFADVTGELTTVRHLLRLSLAVELAGLALFLGVSILLARWATKPVEEAWQRQKQFVSDASHELKTPLTVILTDTELLQSEDCSEEDTKQFVSSIHTMGEQMRGLVEEMLALTRADNAAPERVRENVDWSSCVEEAVLPFEPLFFEQGLSMETDIQPGVTVKGSEMQLRQVTEILLDNAQKYSSPATTTTVRLHQQGHTARLVVTSCGEAIPKEELEKIFLRFYRLDKARSMNHSYGLGLAIARQIVENHGGKIWAESENGENRFIVQLPAQ
jgi:signal transduction histidine kinase